LGPCPKNANNNNVKNCQDDLFLCTSYEDSRFPPPSSAPPVNKASDIDSALHCKSCAPLYAKLQQQITDLWNAHNKLVAEVTELKCVAGNIKQSAVKSDVHVRLVDELAEMKTTVSRLSEEQHADNCSHIQEVNLAAKVCKTLNDINKRKKNVVVTGMPEVASRSSNSLRSPLNTFLNSTLKLEDIKINKPSVFQNKDDFNYERQINYFKIEKKLK